MTKTFLLVPSHRPENTLKTARKGILTMTSIFYVRAFLSIMTVLLVELFTFSSQMIHSKDQELKQPVCHAYIPQASNWW